MQAGKKGLKCLALKTAGGSRDEEKQENRESLNEFIGPKIRTNATANQKLLICGICG